MKAISVVLREKLQRARRRRRKRDREMTRLH